MKNQKSNPEEELLPQKITSFTKSYDIIGDIAVIRVQEHSRCQEKIIADTIMQTRKHIKTVLRQVSGVSGNFRLRRLKWVAGERKTETLYKEFDCVFRVDLKQCYFSPRLSFERMRLARTIRPDETVVNMFAGVGSFSVLMAKRGRAETVYSIDVNPSAVRFMRENVRLNKVQGHVISILGDAKEVIIGHLQKTADRVVMPLPEKAYEYLDYALLALKPIGGWIYYYDFEHALKKEDSVEKVKEKVSEKLQEMGVDFVVKLGRVARHTGPHWYQVVLDIKILRKRLKFKGVFKR